MAFIVTISLLPIGSFVALALAELVVIAVSVAARLGPFRPARRAFLAAPFLLAALPLVFTKSGDPLLNLVENGPLVDRVTMGLPKNIFPHLQCILS